MKTIKVRIPLGEYLSQGYDLSYGDTLILKPEYVGPHRITVSLQGEGDLTKIMEAIWTYLIEVDAQIIKQTN